MANLYRLSCKKIGQLYIAFSFSEPSLLVESGPYILSPWLIEYRSKLECLSLVASLMFAGAARASIRVELRGEMHHKIQGILVNWEGPVQLPPH
jgi:hypothetical protein